ncbi:MAG: hypothetical protein Q8R17_01130 [bacterium]|nr:hypothetical protein [bacterium]
MTKENILKIVGLTVLVVFFYFLHYFYQEAKLRSEKRLEVFKFCVDSVPKDKNIDVSFLKLQFQACDFLSEQL